MHDDEKIRLLRLWQSAAGLDSGESWDNEDQLFGLFQCFAPNGAGVDAILRTLPHGPAILERLLRCFDECDVGAYFLPRSREIRAEVVEPLARDHLRAMRSILAAAGQSARRDDVDAVPAVVMLDRRYEDRHEAEMVLYSTVSDWLTDDFNSELWLLHEAFYSVAASYPLSYWMRWPALAELNPLDHPDPFAPFADLYFLGHWPRVGPNAVFLEPVSLRPDGLDSAR